MIDSLDLYTDIDWSTADSDIFVKLAARRQGEIGAISQGEAALLYEVSSHAKRIVEIGTMFGTSTRLLGAIAKKNNGMLYSIDADMSPTVEKKLNLLNLNNHVSLIKCWSPWFTFVPSWMGSSELFDVIFIDGDHSFISVLTDYHYFNYFLKYEGIIAFHDTNISEVTEAITYICKRDILKFVGEAGRLAAYKKLTQPRETYFQIIDKKRNK